MTSQARPCPSAASRSPSSVSSCGQPSAALTALTSPSARRAARWPSGCNTTREAAACACHPTAYCYTGDADPQVPGGMAAIYRDLAADDDRTRQITADVAAALAQGRHCLVLTQWIAHLQKLAGALQSMGHDPVVLRGGMNAKNRSAALARLQPPPGSPPLLVVATGPYAGEGFDCPVLDTLFLAAPVKWKGRLVQYAGRILHPLPR
jgi:hypothetical protein